MAQPYPSKTGIYQLRRKVPLELQPALGREYKRSLKTRDPKAAKGLFAEEWQRSEEAFAVARAQAHGADTMGERDMQQLAARWFRAEQRAMEDGGDFAQWLVEEGHWTASQGEDSEEHTELVTLRRALDQDPDWSIAPKVQAAVRKTLAANGVPRPTDPAKAPRLEAVFLDHWLKLSDLAWARYEGNWTAQAGLIPEGALSTEGRRLESRGGPTLLDVFETYAADKKLNDGDTRAVQKTIVSYRAIVEQFKEICGDLPARQISRETIREYRALLARMPASGLGLRSMSARQQLAKADADDLPRLSAPTIRNKLRAVSAVLSHAVRLGQLPENPVIAGGSAKAAAKAASRGAAASRKRKDFTSEEIAEIFQSPIYSLEGWMSPRADFGKAWYWMPLLMYYTGARREELAQLAVRDVKVSPESINYLSILAMGDEDDAGRSVKTQGSRRVIPLHPDLIARGLLEYVASLPSDGQLFPLLISNPAGFYGANFGKRWASYLREVVGITRPVSPSHGFRHSFKTLCREVGIPEDVHDAITGHVGSAVSRDYGGMPLSRMAKEILRFPWVAHIASSDAVQGL